MTVRGHATAFAACAVAIALALFALNARNAYHPTDDGFVLAYAWRIAHGEVPYRDFLYVRTPLTLYLHTLEFLAPEGWQVRAGRFAFELELALTLALPAVWAAARLGVRAGPRALALCATFLLFAAHSFPPMPWPTVDAAALSAAGATAFLFSLSAAGARATVLRASASALVALAVLAKQSFAPLAILLGAYALVEAVRLRAARPLLASVIPGALVAAAVLALFAAAGALDALVQQIGAPARLRPTADVPWSGDVAAAGVEPYLRAISPLGAGFALAGALLAWRRGDPAGSLRRKAAAAAVAASLVAIAVEMQFDPYTAGRHLLFLVVGLAAAAAVRWRERDDRAALTAAAAFVAIAWCASLSFAYQTPLLGIAPAALLLEYAWPRAPWPPERLALALVLGIAAAGMIRLELDRPYRDLPRAAQTADLGTVYPRFGELWTNPANVERFAELRALSTRLATAEGVPFVVMPDYPLAYFLSGTRNPLSLDWIQPQEIAGNDERLARELRAARPLVLIAREPSLTVGAAEAPPALCRRPPEPAVALVRMVAAEWNVVAEGRHFCAYRAP